MSSEQKIIAVVGATGAQGGGVVRALKARGQFAVRALTRKPESYRGEADEVVEADLGRPETLARAFEGAYGAFLVTSFWENPTLSERVPAAAGVQAARAAGVQHLVWSTLPDVHALTGGALEVPHFTNKAAADADVAAAGFPYHSFVEAPFYFQNLTGVMAPQPQADGTKAWAIPIDPAARCIHIGDIGDLGKIVAGVLERPEETGAGQHHALASALVSFEDIAAAFRALGHKVAVQRVPAEVYGKFFPGAEELAAMFQYFERCTYFGPDAEAKLARGRAVAVGPFTELADWLRAAAPAA